MKRILFSLLMMGIGWMTVAQTALTPTEMQGLTTTINGSWVSIHDPSVVYRNGMYYIWGTMRGAATSQDLVNFTGVGNTDNAFALSNGTRCSYTVAFNEPAVKRVKNRNGEMVDMPQVDAEAWCSWYAANSDGWLGGNMWAPDIIYNETMGKWCLYFSLNGDHWASVIVLLTASSPTGPFTYQGPVVMGGFTGGKHENQSGANISAPSYKATDMELALGTTLSSMPARYNQGDGWGTFWPNCIDPCVFFDEEGELWMVYGSWSGGIFMLKLDKETGLRDYTYTYESDYDAKGANGVSDPYFGKKIAGGYYVSGEGPYIQHIGEYYYLFVSYGHYAPGGYEMNEDGTYVLDRYGNKINQGGYEMRIFRSKNPDGPYVDASGVSATYTDFQLNFGAGAISDRGLKLMSAYNEWAFQNVAERSQGHNSVCQDETGRNFVVYHTKFNDGTIGHQVRVHQLFQNANGWPVAAPFCYRGETVIDDDIASRSMFTTEEIVGTYHFMLHPYRQNDGEYEEVIPEEVTLKADGTVTGAYSGTWRLKEGTTYLTLKLGSTFYYGVFVEQTLNGATKQNYKTSDMKALCFSAVAPTGVPVWGYKLRPKYAVAANYVNTVLPVQEGATYSSNIDLMFPTSDNVILSWTSSEPEVISETGKYAPRDTAVPVVLTGRMECDEYYWEQAFNVKAQKEVIPTGDYMGGLVAYYDFDEAPCKNAYDTNASTYFGSTGTKPVLTEDYARFGQVLHQSFGAKGSNSFTRIPNPLKDKTGLEGFTISMWVKRVDDNPWDALWGFFNGTTAGASGARLYLTGNNYVGYNDNSSTWFDINHPNNASYTDIPVGKWTLVTITIGATNGVRTYINGSNKAAHVVNASSGVTKVKDLPIAAVIEKVTAMRYLYLGLGSFWGSADCYIDDLMVYNRELSTSDVRALNTMCNRVTDFTKGEGGTSIDEIKNEESGIKNGVYDLSGRRVSHPTRGLYIINGKKTLIK